MNKKRLADDSFNLFFCVKSCEHTGFELIDDGNLCFSKNNHKKYLFIKNKIKKLFFLAMRKNKL